MYTSFGFILLCFVAYSLFNHFLLPHEPRMLQCIFSAEPFPRISSKQAFDEILRFIAETLLGKFKMASLYGGENVGIGIAIKRRIAGQQNVSDDADRPVIARYVVFALEKLGTHVIRGANGCAHRRVSSLVLSRQTEIDQSDIGIFIGRFKQNIFWFYISMDDVLTMQISDGLEQGLDDFGGSVFREASIFRSVSHNLVEELTT
mmetsp:Transcript_18934/g.39606  ORF Transcript_18934/g.39606 Transcript_18934/m.39606 type:complete len:204 (-) Transcript_18934:578-1189(-)